MKDKSLYFTRRSFLELALGMSALPSLASSEEIDFNPKVKGWAIQDPLNKQKVRGFVHIPTVWGEQLRVPDHMGRVTIGLVEAIKKYAGIVAKVDSPIYLSSQHLNEYPFLYIATDKAFELTKTERDNFENYLRNGGFAVLESLWPQSSYFKGGDYSQGEISLKDMIRGVLEEDARFSPIPVSHSLYHYFFDFEDGPPQGSEVVLVTPNYYNESFNGVDGRYSSMPKPRPYLEGIFLDDRLAVVYSGKGYGSKWKEISNNDPQQKMAVNFVVYALTQDGGIANIIP
jgi:hypothetical protein